MTNEPGVTRQVYCARHKRVLLTSGQPMDKWTALLLAGSNWRLTYMYVVCNGQCRSVAVTQGSSSYGSTALTVTGHWSRTPGSQAARLDIASYVLLWTRTISSLTSQHVSRQS
ncbi:hypothetical protein RRG08_014289 [Elysia crispata]|uniref:Uncharacterized protein n=1 Tax=Elysia crispata TaxID=231223 RepID=A0AAE0Y176_9GAST|nr:hypothetical protein RRG08_014289 [Elysia crispata]